MNTLLTGRVRGRAATILACALLAVLFVLNTGFRFEQVAPREPLGSLTLVVPTIRYGLEVERYAAVDTLVAEPGDRLRDVLAEADVNAVFADRLARLAENKARWDELAGRPATLFRDADGALAFLAQEISDHEYLRIDLAAGTVAVDDLDGVQAEYAALTLPLRDGDLEAAIDSLSLVDELADRIRRAVTKHFPDAEGGELGVVYTVKRDEAGAILGYGSVEAVRYALDGEERTAIRYADDELDVEGFFAPDGQPATRTWLLNPAPGSRLSSPFNLRRRHPVLKRVKPHYGTDYAAPYGTPILAASDGVVIARARTRGNGKFVKIKHDERYQSQYLHMKAFAKGIRPGVKVTKGQVIGYVGSTGLSSGPHVCYRFWKDGVQVDHRAENLPTADELDGEALTTLAKREAAFAELLARA